MASSILTEAEVRAVIDALKLEIPPMIRNKLEAWKGVVVEVGTGGNLGSVRVARGDEPTTAVDLLRNWYPVIGSMPAVTDEVWALSWYGGGIVLTGGGTSGSSEATGAFSAYLGADQNNIPATTDTVVAYNTENFDVSDWYNTSNYRYTPQVAGYYRLSAFIAIIPSDTNNLMRLSIRKNGSEQIRLGQTHSADGALALAAFGTQLVVANGTTDYFEIVAFHDFGVSTSDFTANTAHRFTGELVGT